MSSRMEKRAAICDLLDAGMTVTNIANTLKVSRPTVYRAKKRRKLATDLNTPADPESGQN